MVIDTSAVVAVVLGEPDAELYLASLAQPTMLRMSAVSAVEAAIVVEARQGPDAARDLDLLIAHCKVRIEPVDDAQRSAAIAAWRRFGKGRHPASLNFGDCFSYALARVFQEPLLFKGNDFSKTDIHSAM